MENLYSNLTYILPKISIVINNILILLIIVMFYLHNFPLSVYEKVSSIRNISEKEFCIRAKNISNKADIIIPILFTISILIPSNRTLKIIFGKVTIGN